MSDIVEETKERIKELLMNYYKRQARIEPGRDVIHYAWAVYDYNEVYAALDSLLSGWLGLGKNARRFEESFSGFLGAGHSVLTNSGSSANLLAVEALKLPSGSEAITPAVTFPTTLNPLILKGLTPVFLDIEPATYNLDPSKLEKALTDKTKLLMLPHTLGNPNDMDAIMDFANDHELHLIEDSCDALGSRYAGKYLSTFGDLGTFSFYPAHHMTMGEGGAIVTNDEELALTVKSLRDWGRACVCEVCMLAQDPNAQCPLRFNVSPLPDYDRRYTYVNIGYNLKPLDLQAAIGLEQLKRLPGFIEKRKDNFAKLYQELEDYEEHFILPESVPEAEPCWFAFPLTVKESAPFKRRDVVSFLEKQKIATRPLFAGNILRQPAYRDINYRVVGGLENSDRVMDGAFFIGIHPMLGEEHINYIADTFKAFIASVT